MHALTQWDSRLTHVHGMRGSCIDIVGWHVSVQVWDGHGVGWHVRGMQRLLSIHLVSWSVVDDDLVLRNRGRDTTGSVLEWRGVRFPE